VSANETPGWKVASLVLGSRMSRSGYQTVWRARVNRQWSWYTSVQTTWVKKKDEVLKAEYRELGRKLGNRTSKVVISTFDWCHVLVRIEMTGHIG